MMQLIGALWQKRMVRFLFFGGVAAVVNWGSRFAWSMYLPFSEAVLAAYLCGMAAAFVMFRQFVFAGSPQSLKSQMAGFVTVNLLGMAQVWLVSVGLADWLLPKLGLSEAWCETVGHSVGMAVPLVTSFVGHHYISFRGYKK